MKKLIPLLLILMLMSFPSKALQVAINSNKFASPVLDAKKAYQRGNTDLVGIQLEGELILPGIKPENQKRVRKAHRIRPLNRHWRTLDNSAQETRALYSLKRYANRYNLTIMKLIKAKKVEQQGRYRY